MATRTWSGLGTTNNWTEAANWDAVPVAGDSLIFDGNTRLTPNNDFADNTAFSGITFAATAGVFTIGGLRVALSGTVTNSSSNTQIITFATSGSFTVTGAATIAGLIEVINYTLPIISTGYTILSSSALTGEFQPASTILTLGGRSFQATYPTNTVLLTDDGSPRTFLPMFF
jgi:hypothetical protein